MTKRLTEEEIRQFIKGKPDQRKKIGKTFESFTQAVIPELRALIAKSCQDRQNVYQLSGAVKLSAANTVTRTYNTKLGLLWERIADLAPNVVSPELDFGYKIPEVDIIVLDIESDKLFYTQLKTQKNTLTGSQSNRTVLELGAYENHWFVACIDTNCGSTMPGSLNRLVGREFWDKIGIDYDRQIVPNLKKSVLEVEKLF